MRVTCGDDEPVHLCQGHCCCRQLYTPLTIRPWKRGGPRSRSTPNASPWSRTCPRPPTLHPPHRRLTHSWRWALSGPAPSLRDVSSGEKALEARALCPSGGEAGEDGGREDNIPNTSPATFTRPKDPKSKAPPSARRCSQRGRKKWAQPKREEAPFHVLRWWRIRQIHQNKKILDLAKNGVLVYLIL